MQICDGHMVYLIDMIALAGSSRLNKALINIISSKNTLCIGFSFDSDIRVLSNVNGLTFPFYFARFIDIQKYSKIVYPDLAGAGLALVCQATLGRTIPKNKKVTMSNWEQRPLSYQ